MMEKKKKRTVILDTSAFVAGFNPFSIKEEQYVTPMVLKEITEKSIDNNIFKIAIENEKIKIKIPKQSFLKKIKNIAEKMGDIFFLSPTDIQILALALEIKKDGYDPLIATDDYAIQNISNKIGVTFAPLTTFGIRYSIKWGRYCPSCKRKYPASYKFINCEFCGSKIKRKFLEKKKIN